MKMKREEMKVKKNSDDTLRSRIMQKKKVFNIPTETAAMRQTHQYQKYQYPNIKIKKNNMKICFLILYFK